MKTLLFDLDGTLIHTADYVLPAFTKTIRSLPGAIVPSEAELLRTFGMPETEIWRFLLPDASMADREKAQNECTTFIEDAIETEDILLPHAREVLQGLYEAGHTLTTASNCGVTYLSAVLDGQKIRHLFTHPLCLESVHGRRKADILAAHLRTFERATCIMIGDRATDVEAAKTHGIPCIGCDFGFGDIRELRDADVIIHDIRELPDAIATLP